MFLVRLAALSLVCPFAASATVYQWTDAHGVTVYSNRPPAAEAKVSNVQVAMQDDEPPAAPKPVSLDELAARVLALEQQVQALQNQPSGYAAPPPSYYPPPDYYPQQSYPADYYPWMSGWGSPFVTYPSSFIVVNGRRFFRPVFPVHHRFVVVRHGGVRTMPMSHGMVASRGMMASRTMVASRAMGGARRR